MELIIFWLMPVVLIVVLILLVLQAIRHNQKPSLYIVEPVGLLVRDWLVARFVPDIETLKQIFKLLATSNLSEGTLLEQVIVSAAGSLRLQSKTDDATLIEHQPVGTLAEQLVLAFGAKKRSVLIGPFEQIEKFVDDEKAAEYQQLTQQSAENGFLALTIATASVHGDKPKTKHLIEGLVILEPVIAENQLAKVRQIGRQSVRFLTVLPDKIVSKLYNRVFPDQTHFSLDAEELATLLPPKFAEQDLEKASVVGGADLLARHQTIRVWQRQYHCVVISRNPEDQGLPITPINHL